MSLSPDLASVLDAESGLTCVVGAGGKKTTLYALADRLDGVGSEAGIGSGAGVGSEAGIGSGAGVGSESGVGFEAESESESGRPVVTATVRIPIFDAEVEEVAVTEDPETALDAADRFPLGLVPERERDDRYRGYDPETVAGLAEVHDGALLVKADGARSRWLKAPNRREPQIPEAADTVVPVASVRVVGEPLTEERVHRPDRVADIAGCDSGERIGPEDVAEVLASDRGGLKNVPESATAIPVVNMVDSPDLEAVGREIAEKVLARAPESVPRVVLARMVADDPVVAVAE